jgi:probable F420-dependent oxidoreductase
MFGLFTPIVQPINLQPWEDAAGIEDLTGIATEAESLGYDFVTVCDHAALAVSAHVLYGGARFYDPVATIGYLAAKTRRLRFATHVYQIPLRSPLITAKAFATLDVLSDGRVIAGFGVGRREYESRAAGIAFGDRGAVADEYLQAVLALWKGCPATQHGKFVHFDELVCQPAPARRMSVWIGGNTAAGLRRALAYGDAWTPWALTPSRVREMMQQAAASAPSGFRIVGTVAPLGGRALRGEPAPPRLAPGPGAAESCLEEIARWKEAGATDFILDLPSPSLNALVESMAWFAEEVRPVL